MRSIIGYAQADFKTLIADQNLYIDRTEFIRTMENQSNRNLIFVRPRRFGKSLWISILYYYYAIEQADKFETLFANVAIGKNPTPLRNSYMILKFQFSGIDVETEHATFYGFRANVKAGIQSCMSKYSDYFSNEEKSDIERIETPADMIQTFFRFYKDKNIVPPIYILIDEYDQFANELVAFDAERFQAVVGRTGYVRKFYEMIKFAANEGVVNRFFATGVSPLTVDSMTSGFNITSSLNLELEFHDLLGFRASEVADILLKVGAKPENLPAIMSDLKEWYNGYLFHEEAEERLYNSDMIMYFASHYEKRQKYPSRMLDANIATDYTKVKKIFNIQQREAEFIPVLKELTTEGIISAKITDYFNLEKGFSEDDMKSLLFYMGWTTIRNENEGRYIFEIPNRVIRELYYQYFIDIVERETGLKRDTHKIQNALEELSKNNDPLPFLDIIKALIDKDLSFRDAQRFNEKHLKMLMVPYLSLSASHYLISESEWENGYIDVLLLKRPHVTTKYNFILELKYIKKADEANELYIQKVAADARQQLASYLQSENAQRISNLKAWLIILVAREWQIVEEVKI